VAVLTPSAPTYWPDSAATFLRSRGWLEGQHLRFERRYAAGFDERLPALAAQLVALEPRLIVTAGTPATRAVQAATRRIPIVTVARDHPVRAGLVGDLERPGGNTTGVMALAPEVAVVRLRMLGAAVPGLARVAVLWNPDHHDSAAEWRDTEAAGREAGLDLVPLAVRRREDVEPALEAAGARGAGALLVLTEPIVAGATGPLWELAARRRLPAMWSHRWLAQSGGLMSYGPSSVDLSLRVADYVARILQGARPGELPVARLTRFELVVNLPAARAIGLRLPGAVLLAADQVIE
jgi:putative ABC transport system substrate-binding protein